MYVSCPSVPINLHSLGIRHTQYGQPVTKKGSKAAAAPATGESTEEKKLSNHAQRNLDAKKKEAKVDPLLDGQFAAGRLYATISSRPGQSGRADGYILEGKELEVSSRFEVIGKGRRSDEEYFS
jgi:small subunit ribosomal protein S8e